MANNISHFAIQADDVERARGFYERVFGWRFEAWGPPGFYNISTGDDADPGIHGALYERQRPRAGNDAMIGYRCTISVDDVDASQALIEANGGTIVHQKSTIPGIGTLIEFADTEGNIVCAMRYHQ